MNYSQTGIANLALNRVGARGTITDVNQSSPNAQKVLAVWDYVFQEVLSERDWKFAKTRVNLSLLTEVPLYGYSSAWALPADFLRFVRPHKRPPDRNLYMWLWGPEGYGWYNRADPPFWPCGFPYVVETIQTGTTAADLPSYTQCVLTDYAGCTGDVNANAKINYIQIITDYSKLMPGFVNCLAYRLAAEIAISITEDDRKFQAMSSLYRDTLNSAEAQNESMDFQENETGSETWERAGRLWGW